jgi:hypothetical protein
MVGIVSLFAFFRSYHLRTLILYLSSIENSNQPAGIGSAARDLESDLLEPIDKISFVLARIVV